MEQGQKVVGEIVLTCVVLYAEKPSGGSRETTNSSKFIKGGKTTKKLTERLLQQPWVTGWAGGHNLRRLSEKKLSSFINQFF